MFHEDRSFSKSPIDDPVEGTQISPAQLGSSIPGRLPTWDPEGEDIAFESGQRVDKDQVLIRLDDSIDIAALEALQADQALAEVQFKRVQGLMEKSVTSKSEFDEAQARFDAAWARVRQQEAVIRRKVIRAPFAGLAGIRKVDLGEFIEVGAKGPGVVFGAGALAQAGEEARLADVRRRR